MPTLKLAGLAILAAALLIGGFCLGKKHTGNAVPTQKTVYVDRIVQRFVQKSVTKDVVRTVTKPDGTKIVIETKSHTEVKTDSKEVTKTSVAAAPLPKYSIAINLRPETIFPMKGVYTLEVGRRLWETPLWITASGNTKREFTVGLRYEF